MEAASVPTKFPAIWANGASSPYVRPIPTPSQQSVQNGAASLFDGFPPLCFVPVATGGAGPFGSDTNGILQQITAGVQWQQAGAPLPFDSVFSSAIGGYPKNAIVADTTDVGLFWVSLSDNNTESPETTQGFWQPLVPIPLTGNTTYFVSASGSDSTGLGTSGSPWATWQHAVNYVLGNVNANGFVITISGSAGSYTNSLGPIVNITSQVPGQAAPIVFTTTGGTVNLTGAGSVFNVTNANIEISGTFNLVTTALTGATGGSITVNTGGKVTLAGFNTTFGTAPQSHILSAGGLITAPSLGGWGYSITGAAPYHWFAESNGTITMQNTATGSINGGGLALGFTIFANVNGSSGIYCGSVTFSSCGAFTGERYNASTNGIINTGGGGASYLPGNSAGTVNLVGGVYGNGSGQYV